MKTTYSPTLFLSFFFRELIASFRLETKRREDRLSLFSRFLFRGNYSTTLENSLLRSCRKRTGRGFAWLKVNNIVFNP